MNIDDRLTDLGLALPKPMNTEHLPFQLAKIDGTTMYLAGHIPTDLNGVMTKQLGKVGAEITPDEGYQIARQAALGLLATIKQTLGSLDRVASWLHLFGMVNVAPGFKAIPPIINGASDVILDVFGPVDGSHTRSAIGVAELPFGVPVELEAQIKVKL
jgi:enamine deaminase RidA (YjgF/YER057c/UK114 family)